MSSPGYLSGDLSNGESMSRVMKEICVLQGSMCIQMYKIVGTMNKKLSIHRLLSLEKHMSKISFPQIAF